MTTTHIKGDWSTTFANYDIPAHTQQALKNYVQDRVPPGGFLYAVLTNNMTQAFGRADTDNAAALQDIVRWLYNEPTALCWGMPEKVAAWLDERETP